MTTRVFSAEELEVCEQVGRGGFGVVYRGLIKATSEEVAIKQIDLENDQSDLFEINNEILIISECRLPQITKYLGCFVKHYKLWVIMEFVNGGSLFELLAPGRVEDESIIMLMAKEILTALEYLHNQGKIHRDLKLQNVLLNTNGQVKLTDFGVSTQLSSNFSRRNTTVGTPYWMAPEVILNDNGGHNNKADIWSLGCCCFELFTGKPPLQVDYPPMKALRFISRCHRNEDFVKLIGLRDISMSSGFRDFLTKCFVVDPKERSGASNLLNHKWINKTNTIPEPEQLKRIKSLITRKHKWDQENHVLKSQKFYLPTDMVKNQQKWNNDNEESNNKTINFDFSTINFNDNNEPEPEPELENPPQTHNVTIRDSSLSPSSSAKPEPDIKYHPLNQLDSKQKNLTKSLQPEVNKILNRIFHKLESRHSLSTEQYDLLVSLNAILIKLLDFSNNDDKTGSKILMCQYLKYLIKELMKPDISKDNVRLTLQKLTIPSDLKDRDNNDTIKAKAPGPFDDIENSLFDTWIDEMRH